MKDEALAAGSTERGEESGGGTGLAGGFGDSAARSLGGGRARQEELVRVEVEQPRQAIRTRQLHRELCVEKLPDLYVVVGVSAHRGPARLPRPRGTQ